MKAKAVKIISIFLIMIIDLLLLTRVTYFRYYEPSSPTLLKATIKDNKMVISFDVN